MEWKDETSYSKSDVDRIPAIWKLHLKNMTITIHRHIHYPPDQWLLSCDALGISKKPLINKGLAEAKLEAKEILNKKLTSIMNDINSI